MRTVSHFEANLLRILHAFLGRATLGHIHPLLISSAPRPARLSRDCVELVQDSLAKGCVRLLAMRGGWRPERFLRDGEIVEGRLWRRTRPADLALEFSGNSLDFLMWITAISVGDTAPPWRRSPSAPLTLADRLLIFLAYETLRPLSEARPFLKGFAGHSLCRLAFPQDFPDAAPLKSEKFLPWTHGLGSCVLETLQQDLAKSWVRAEQSKGLIVQPQEMLALGKSQEETLDAFLSAVDSAGRRDLARFFLRAAQVLLNGEPPPATWVAALDVSGLRMADRARVYGAATTFLRRMETFEAWQRHARGVGFLDEDYAASQLWKGDWEQLDGDHLGRRAHAIVQALDPLRNS